MGRIKMAGETTGENDKQPAATGTTENKPVTPDKTPPLAPAVAKAPVRKKATARKKTARKKRARKKTGVSKQTPASRRRAAARSRTELIKRLKADLEASRAALRVARDAAREEIKLVNAAAKNEIAVLKDQLAKAMKREEKLRKISQKKAKKMLAAGERWEKKQLDKLKKATEEARKRMKK